MSEAVATERVGRYQLLEPLGAGPTGVVSRAKVFGVAGFERQFAIKRFLPEVASSTGAQALSAAARAYGGLEHPRIARMAEFGVSQGTTFTAVELVPGVDAMRLATEARNAGLALASGGVLALVSQAARAIGYAHGRGISHLGLAPTNVIVTPDGDVKITDFAVLAATLPQRPVDAARLSQRIAYLAPEQIAGEATSAATDVFALGVLAYELVAGQRAFRGDSPAQIAQAIVAGPPPELQLPRPIVRVLQRCLARSPFERFPDARALADALDAALRVAPIPGSRKDVGAVVKEIVERLATLNEGAMSGMLNLNPGTGPIPRANLSDLQAPDIPTDAYLYPAGVDGNDATVPSPRFSGLEPGAGSTQPDLPRPMSTVPGLAPPPIPVPQGIVTPPPMPSVRPAAQTIQGLPRPPSSPPAPPPIPRPGSGSQPGIGEAKPGSSSQPGIPGLGSAGSPPQIPPVIRPRTSPAVPTSVPPVPKLGQTVLGQRAPQVTPPPLPSVRPPAPAPAPTPTPMGPPLGAPGALGIFDSDDFADEAAPTSVPRERPPTNPAAAPAMTDAGISSPNALAPTPLTSVPPLAPVVPAPIGSMTLERPPGPRGRPPTPYESIPEDLPTREHQKPDEALLRASRPSSPPSRAPVLFPDVSTQPGMGRPSPASAIMPEQGEPPSIGRTPTPRPKDIVTTDMPPVLADGLAHAIRHPTNDIEMLVEEAHRADALAEFPDEKHSEGATPLEMHARQSAVMPTTPPPLPARLTPVAPLRLETVEVLSEKLPVPKAPNDGAPVRPVKSGGSKAPLIVLGVLFGAAAIGGVVAWQLGMLDGYLGKDESVSHPTTIDAPLVASKDDAAVADHAVDAATAAPADAAALSTKDAGSAAKSGANDAGSGAKDAGVADAVADAAVADAAVGKDAGTPPSDAMIAVATPDAAVKMTPGDGLSITSTPAGARVFIDGSDQGVTPTKLAATGDHHTVALILPAHELYIGQITGKGNFSIPLKDVTPSSGPAGIKVIKCKDKDRYYVFVDGKPTGMTCPTERIECALGAHTVEVYDAQTDSRKKWDITITDTEHSFRVRIEQ